MGISYKWIGAGTMLSAILLSGCDLVNDAAQAVRQDAQEVAFAAGNTVVGTVNDFAEHLTQDGERIELSSQRDIGSEAVLQIDHKVGNIKIVQGTGNSVSVKTTIWFLNEKSYMKIAENAETSLVSRNGKLEIVTNAKGHSDRDLWDWSQSKYGYSEFKIDYEVEVPAAITGFEIANNVGEVTMDQLKGSYQVENNVGKIVVNGASIMGKSSIKSDAGSLQLNIKDAEKGSSLKANTNVGSIHASLEETLACSLKLDSDLGIISGAPRGKSDLNGSGPLITLSSSVGSISVE
ncbi:hypothetical protein GRF59_19380 [Paenibacillus sp. HJL G12]|uniref:DUF4097 domain-containing protein n=1 Tax=Paenibacillus dendrobii TaxID=2691084 RepID=A0A7X3IPC6_9BACL|nr:DUF4097 family beta strand repeat-containing protein [Paenibacillus dendrobii]MWV45782.1 hypothetical protein [Paenibacillus dendrobii]